MVEEEEEEEEKRFSGVTSERSTEEPTDLEILPSSPYSRSRRCFHHMSIMHPLLIIGHSV